jgi:hypothetical protein
VDILLIAGDRARNPADNVRISRQPLDLDWRRAHCVVVRETEAPPEAGGGMRKGSQDLIRRPNPAVGNEEGPQGPTHESIAPTRQRGGPQGPTRNRIGVPRREAARPTSRGWWGRRFPARLSGDGPACSQGRIGSVLAAGSSDTAQREWNPGSPSAWPRGTRAASVVRLLGAASRLRSSPRKSG